jgi:hypothetical protein
MVAMQRSYKMLKEEGSDLKACDGKGRAPSTVGSSADGGLRIGNQIKDFFAQVGLKAAFDFDTQVIQTIKEGVKPANYENLSSHDLF